MKSFIGLVLALALLAPNRAHAQLAGNEVDLCNPRLEKILLKQRLVSKVTFPASSEGIELNLAGEWDQKQTSRLIKNSGVGIDVDDPATVTQVKTKKGWVEIQLNGGGFGTFWDSMNTNQRQRDARAASGKASGGSRINLRFNRPVTCDELADAAKMMTFLAPLADAGSLKVLAAQQAIAPEWTEAAAQKRVLVGMDKTTVFAIMGEPKQKQVDIATDPPTEKWQYELPDLKTRVVTFREGKVAKVDEF